MSDINSNSDFYYNLIEYKEELKFNYKELASILNINYDTFKRRVSEGKGFTEKEKGLINKFIEEKTVYRNYKHMDSVDFCKYVNELILEFNLKQAEFAEMLKTYNQSQISKIVNMKAPLKLSTKEQFEILSLFLELSHRTPSYLGVNPANIFEQHYDTAKTLCLKLYGNLKDFDSFEEDKKTYSDNKIMHIIIDYLLTLPVDEQEIILKVPLAFFDSLLFNVDWVDDWVYIHKTEDFFNKYMELSLIKQNKFLNTLRRIIFETGGFSHFGGWIFDLITQKRFMIDNARDRKIEDCIGICPFGVDNYEYSTHFLKFVYKKRNNEKSVLKFNAEVQRKRFEQAIFDMIQFDIPNKYPKKIFDDLIKLIIEEINYKLKMGSMQWYLNMLVSILSYEKCSISLNDIFYAVKDNKYSLDSFYEYFEDYF